MNTSTKVTTTREGGVVKKTITTATVTRTITKQSKEPSSQQITTAEVETTNKYKEALNSRSAPYQENLQFEIGEAPFNSNGFNVKDVEEELRVENGNIIEGLQEEQFRIYEVDNERTESLGFLERAHLELQGEQDQDAKETLRLQGASEEIQTEIELRKTKFNSQIENIKDQLKDVEEKLKETETEKLEKTESNRKLQDVIDIPEDLEEEGFSKEAVSLRNDNSELKTKFSEGTEDLLKERDERDQLLADHKKTVEEYNQTIHDYYIKFFQTEEARKIQGDHKNNVNFQIQTIKNQNTNLDQNIQLSEIDIEYLSLEVKALRSDLAQNDSVYNAHITELSDSITQSNREIGSLRDRFHGVEAKNRDLNLTMMKQKLDLEDHEKEMDAIEAIKYNENSSELQSNLKKIEEQRRKHQDELENVQGNLSLKLTLFQDYESQRRREKEGKEKLIESQLQKLLNSQENINSIQKSIDELNNRIVSDNNKDTVGITLDTEKDSLNLKLRWAQEERDNSRKQIKDAIELLRMKQQEIIDQEKQLELLRGEINSIKTLIEEKSKIIIELENEIEICDERITYLVGKFEDLDAEINEMIRGLQERDAKLKELNLITGTPTPIDVNYKAVKGDEVDEMLAMYMQDCPVPVKRLGKGFYLFGTRKIYAKIMN